MFAYRGGGGETTESRLRGGLDVAAVAAMEESSEEEDDGEDEVKKEDSAAAAAAEPEADIPILILPEPRPAIFTSDDGTLVRFDKRVVPIATMHGVPPQVLMGASSVSKELINQKTSFCNAAFTPGPVASSPMVALIMSIVVPPKRRPGAPPFVPGPQPSQARYMMAGNVCFQLNQLKMLCAQGAIPFHTSWNADKLLRAGARYLTHGQRVAEANGVELGAFYQRVAAVGVVTDATLEEFMRGCEERTLRYIHLIEHYLYTCLVEPYTSEAGVPVPIELVLTPREFPAFVPSSSFPSKALEEVVDFFTHKQMSTPHTRIRAALIRADRRDMYKNYVPRDVIIAYMRDLDTDGLIKDEFFYFASNMTSPLASSVNSSRTNAGS